MFKLLIFKLMAYDRKQQKRVSKKSRYKQGVIDPKTCKKLYESVKSDVIKYQSALELNFIKYCEACTSIAKWANEPFSIQYYSRLDKRMHEYFPDFIIESVNGQRTIIETKPMEQTMKPSCNSSQWLKQQWVKNVDKWHAANEYAKAHGMKFMIVTENFFP